MKWENCQLKDIANYWTGKVEASVLDATNYISTENLIPDKGGVANSNYVPTSGNANSYSENDVLISNIRPYFKKIWFANKQGGCSNDVLVFRAKENVEPLFLYYQLSQDAFFDEMVAGSNGTKMPRGNKGSIMEFKLQIPPLPTQRRIASILSAYDDLIENNLKRIKLLEEKAFVAYKILMSNERLIEGKVGDLADVKSGYAFKGADWTDEGFPVIKIKNIGNNDIDLMDCSLIPENIAEAAFKFKLNAGDLLIAMTGATVGKIGMMPKTETSFYLNQRVGLFKPKVENAELFLFCFYNEPSAKVAVESLASGAAQPNISGGQLESIKLFYPKLETVTKFGSSIKSHFELIWNLKQQNTKLRKSRDILLPRLMSGEIQV
jgi:type I restriction enzyme S subunit